MVLKHSAFGGMVMLENLEQLLSTTLAKVANTAKNGSGSTFAGNQAVATEWLTVAKNEPANHAPVETLASLAKPSQSENAPEPAPVQDLSQISHFSQQSEIKENPFCSESTFELYGPGFSQSAQSLERLGELYTLGLQTGAGSGLAWHFAEAGALFEHIGDGRKSCLECANYSYRWGTEQGTCAASGVQPLQHMKRGALVNFHWFNRCPKHTSKKHDKAGA